MSIATFCQPHAGPSNPCQAPGLHDGTVLSQAKGPAPCSTTTRGETTFTELKQVLAITDGNFEAHLKKLVAASYVTAHKQTGRGRPQTLYALSATGEKGFAQYVASLQAVLGEG